MDGCFGLKCKRQLSSLDGVLYAKTVEDPWVKQEDVDLYKNEKASKKVMII